MTSLVPALARSGSVLLLAGSVAAATLAPAKRAAPPRSPALAPAAGDWMPLRPGSELSYRIRGQSTSGIAGQPGSPQAIEGSESERVERAGKRFRLVSRITLRSGGKSAPPATRRVDLAADANGVYLAGHELENAPPETVQYDPPLTLLKLPARPGDRWKVGTYRSHGIRMEQEAEVLDFEDVETPAGTFRHCLKVRYVAPLTGSLTVQGQELRIEKGDVQYVEWFASGVGNVKQVSTYDQTFTAPDGRKVTSSETRTRVLTARSLATRKK